MTIRFSFCIALALSVIGCGGGGSGVIASPYESCQPGDTCTQGTVCSETTLPVSAGFTGALCTVGCNTDQDCPQDLNNYAAICVNGQCYTQCPAGNSTCPYGTGCVTLQDQNGFDFDICTP